MSDYHKSALLIEDDREIANFVTINLHDIGVETEHVSDGETGLQRIVSGDFAVIILDIMLPKLDGISVCREIRAINSHVPILILSARGEEIDRILGLELGADDYLTKPFSVRELMARVKALIRRAHISGTSNRDLQSYDDDTQSIYKMGHLELNVFKHKASLNGHTLDITAKEFDLLALFMKNPGRAFTRAELLKLVWDYAFEGYEHTVNTHINRLRNKIETDPTNPQYLKTVWGVGYRFAEEAEQLS